MKKKIAICGALLVGFCLPLAACTEATVEPPHEHTYAQDWSFDDESHWLAPTCDDTDERKDLAPHGFDGGNRCTVCGYKRTPVYQPGEVVADEETRAAILFAIKTHEFAQCSVAYDVDLTGSYNGEPFEYTEGSEGDRDPAQTAESVPVFVKLAKNALVYAEGEIVKTEAGYAVTADLADVLDRMLADFGEAVSGLRKGVLPVGLSNSIADLLWQPSMQNMLETLLYGVTAEELTTLFSDVLPAEATSILPEAEEGTGAFDYLWICLRSPELAGALAELYLGDTEGSSGLDAMLSGGVASAPLAFVWSALFQKDFVQSDVHAEVEALRERLAESERIGVIACDLDETYALIGLRAELTFDDVRYESEEFSFTLDGRAWLSVSD